MEQIQIEEKLNFSKGDTLETPNKKVLQARQAAKRWYDRRGKDLKREQYLKTREKRREDLIKKRIKWLEDLGYFVMAPDTI